jgi:hypothetical protein
MTQVKSVRSAPARALAPALVIGALVGAPTVAVADEGGVSFWVPGFFGSLAATPLQPGFSVVNIYYHTTVDAGADVAFARQVSRGRLTANFNANLNLTPTRISALSCRSTRSQRRFWVGRPPWV